MALPAIYSDLRVLILTPTGDDAIQTAELLNRVDVHNEIVEDLRSLSEHVQAGAGAVIITEEAIDEAHLAPLIKVLEHQEPWSDLPVLLITSKPDSDDGGRRIVELFRNTGNLYVLQRPLTILTLVTAVKSAVRARTKQCQIKALLVEQRRLVEEAESAVRTKNEFISIASHELKTPITILKLRLEIAAREFAPEENKVPSLGTLRRLFEIGLFQVERLTTLVEDLLNVSLMRAGKLPMHFELIDLAETIRDSADRLREQIEQSGSKLNVRIEDGIVGMWDAARVEQLFGNLIINALKYAPKTEVHVTLLRAGGAAELSVRDFGPGIPHEYHDKLFNRFERAGASKKIGGLGLGLFICRQIARLHGGDISLRTEDEGTSFIATLPIRLSVGGEK